MERLAPLAATCLLLALAPGCGDDDAPPPVGDAGGGRDGAPGTDAARDGAGPLPDAALDPDAGAGDAGPPEVPLPTGTPAADEVRINETVRLQTMDGVGADTYAFPWASDLGWSWDAVSFVYDELDLRYVRLAPWFGFWEPDNDDADPMHLEWSGFGTTDAVPAWHDVPYATWLGERGIEVLPGIWDVADWLAGGSPRRIAPSMYPELGESIAAYVLHLRDQGVHVPVAEVQNEPAIEAGIQYDSPEDVRDAALAVLDALDANGLGDVMLHGPNHHTPTDAAAWAEVWLADPRLASRTAAVSYHTWWSDAFEDYDAIRQVAEAAGKPVWATEMGYCALVDGCFDNTHFLRPETWGTAWDTAESFHRAIAWSHAARVYHWTVLGHDAVVSGSGQRYPTFHVLAHFANWIPPGARFLESASGDADVRVLAFLLPSGERSVVLLNEAGEARTLRLTSVRGDALAPRDAVTTTETAWQSPLDATLDGEGRVVLELPARSVTSAFL